jgi:chorismate mutase
VIAAGRVPEREVAHIARGVDGVTSTEDLSVDADIEVAGYRARIDELDDAVISLLAERRLLSFRVQSQRLSSAGDRIDSSRETDVEDRYRNALGPGGRGVAKAILSWCAPR